MPPLPSLGLLILTVSAASLAAGDAAMGFDDIPPGSLPPGWSASSWNAPRPAPEAVVVADDPAGGRVLRIAVGATGAAGVSLPARMVEEGMPTLRATMRVRVLAGAVRPWAFFTCWQESRYLGRVDLKVPNANLERWSPATGGVRPDELPAGTGRLVLNLAGIGEGVLAYDDVAVAEDPAEFRLTGSTPGHWLAPGEAFMVRPAGALPAAVQAIEAVVYDSAGVEVGRAAADRARIAAEGLRWMPPGPGLYELAPVCVLADGSRRPHVERWAARKEDGSLVECVRDRIACAVASAPTRPAAQRWPAMGISCSDSEEIIDLADRLGAAFVRYHWIPWGWSWHPEEIIEREAGKLDWTVLDRRVAYIRKLGMGFVGNVVTTPRWASPRPEAERIDICIVEWSTYAPKDLSAWTRFLDAIVRRYPDALAWELWNEPHLPGGSVFWHDSPESFVRLLGAGYQAVKAADPQAVVWIGGLGGRRYLPFYKELLRLGGAGFYDRLALHGTWCDPAPFRALDRAAGLAVRPWVNSEFHATLVGREHGTIPSEAAIAKRMLVDLLSQVAKGAERIALFETLCNAEREMLAATGTGIVDGFYRQRPRIEPRLAACVVQRLGTLFGRQTAFAAQAVVGMQRAALFISDGRPLLACWTDAAEAEAPQPALAEALAGARVSDWEGRPVPAGAPLRPGVIYWAEDATAAAAVLVRQGGEALASERQRRIASGPTATGIATVGEAPAAWQGGWAWVGVDGAQRPAGFDARFACALRGDRLHITIEVADAVHRAHDRVGDWWRGDSVQIGIDAYGDGVPREDVKLQVARTATGPVLWKEAAPFIGGDLPQGWTPARRLVANGSAAIEDIPGGLRYRIDLPITELYPWRFDRAAPLRMSVLVNDDDGAGRIGWLEWGGGIGGGADPGLYGSLVWKE